MKIPVIFPTSKCKLRLLKLERVKDFLLMEQEFIQNQEIRRPREEQNEVRIQTIYILIFASIMFFNFLPNPSDRCFLSYIPLLTHIFTLQTERAKVEDVRGTPLTVGT